jgi:NitT/TauT family transport system permease protein
MRDLLRKVGREYLPPVSLVTIVLVVWEIAADAGYIHEIVAPAPTRILRRLVELLPILWDHSLMTLLEVLYGYAAGIVLGFLLGVAIVHSRSLERALYPLVVVSQTIPRVALAPIFLLLLGWGIASKVATVILWTFFPVVIATVDGMRSVDPELLLFARTLSASEWQVLRKIRLPACLPHFFTGIKVTAPYAIIAAVVGEWIGANRGLGALMLRVMRDLYIDTMLATVAVMTLIGMLLFLLAHVLLSVLAPWYRAKLERMG